MKRLSLHISTQLFENEYLHKVKWWNEFYKMIHHPNYQVWCLNLIESGQWFLCKNTVLQLWFPRNILKQEKNQIFKIPWYFKVLHMCFERFLLAFESHDLSQADKRSTRVSSFLSFNFWMISYGYTQKSYLALWQKNFGQFITQKFPSLKSR